MVEPAPSDETTILCRVHAKEGCPTLAYLPGIHGDWTLFASFRQMASAGFQVIEFTYPRRLDWNLEDYARAVEEKLMAEGVREAWILAESFGSQVAWELLRRRTAGLSKLTICGVILAGGFVKHPACWMVRAAERFFGATPRAFWKGAFWAYAKVGALRHRNAPETAACLREFVARRTDQDLKAIQRRLCLIAENDPRWAAAQSGPPIFMLAGAIDPIVPAWPVWRWLSKNTPDFAGVRIVWPADHNVLGTAPAKALEQIGRWVASKVAVRPESS
jgi:pimeloyl-ACP methyl ester carboxylesterase